MPFPSDKVVTLCGKLPWPRFFKDSLVPPGNCWDSTENPQSTDLYRVKGVSEKPISQIFRGGVHGHRYVKSSSKKYENSSLFIQLAI
jgi:hypothetical protein